jgi:hypothetical protein
MQAYGRAVCLALLLCGTVGIDAANGQLAASQLVADPSAARTPGAAGTAAAQPAGAAAFAIEAAGGTAGAALGYALTLTGPGSCADDVSCALRNAGGALLLGTVGAAGGTYASGQLLGTRPSGWGALVGAVAGAAAVIGLDHIWTDVFPDTSSARIVVFSVTQGLITAAGSRIAASLR